MRLIRKFSLLVLFFPFSLFSITVGKAITYEDTTGRFADNLLSYIHAKYLSYKYNLPLLYKPFVYADSLVLSRVENLYSEALASTFCQTITLGTNRRILEEDPPSTLYHVPYFPDSTWELTCCVGYYGKWDPTEMDWDDPAFISLLRKVLTPIDPPPPLSLPSDRISVAMHIRRGGNYDDDAVVRAFPLKFLPLSFYIDQLHFIYEYLGHRPLYVHIFTDDTTPGNLLKKISEPFVGKDIVFNTRIEGNSDTNHVIEDFVSLLQFDCLIHSESNYSYIPSKLKPYLISVYADSFRRKRRGVIYDHVVRRINDALIDQL